MKKMQKILFLLLALTMLISLVTPVLAYDTDGTSAIDANGRPVSFNSNGDPVFYPYDTWYLSRVYHWVVRGETLQDIADIYGTTVTEIRKNNWNYFRDLELRNDTTGLNIGLENGVRLKIYDLLTVKHYVSRGDTLRDIANGVPFRYSGVDMTTTIDAIKTENADWFRNLELLNATQATEIPLMESNEIFAFYRGLTVNGLSAQWAGWDVQGSPLYITVPVTLTAGIDTWTLNIWSFMRNASEINPGALDVLVPQQRIFGNTVPSNSPIFNQSIGWDLDFAPIAISTPVRLNIPWDARIFA